MQKSSLKLTGLVALLGLAYALLFHHAELGLNLFLFDALLIGLVLFARPELAKHQGFAWSVGGLLFAAGSVVIVHSAAAILAHHLTYLLVLGFAQARELRFLWFGLLMGLEALFAGPIRWFRGLVKSLHSEDAASVSRVWPWAKQVFIPIAVALPFLVLYASGNEKIGRGLDSLIYIFDNLSIGEAFWWSAFLAVFGFLLTLGMFFPRMGVSRLVRWQSSFADHLRRDKQPNPDTPPLLQSFLSSHDSTGSAHRLRSRPKKMLALRGEYRQAVLTFATLNLLLAVVNATDLRYVWLVTGELSAATLSQYVHNSTGKLVCSIILAMFVILYYFRRNLNFLREGPHLAPLAKLWVAQNALLALSVGVRNWHYVDAYGLAFGRVQIAFGLLLMLFGLYTLFRKVRDRLTLSYLLQTNGMAAWLGLLLFAAVNWSGVITRFNLATQTTEEIDWQYLRSHHLEDNDFLLPSHQPGSMTYGRNWDLQQPSYTDWRSWNYAEWRNLRELE
jgi:hypothetical protein